MPQPEDENSMMRVLALCTFPEEAAATRFRLHQFVELLRSNGIEVDVRPYLSNQQFRDFYSGGGIAMKIVSSVGSLGKRISQLRTARDHDLLFVQREAMPFGPGIFEWLYQRIGRMPMVLDLDDATYLRYVSPTYGRLGSFFKFFGKTDKLIDRADLVVCGNRFIAQYVEKRGGRSIVIPTVVDTEVFKPIEKANEVPVIGWIGTHSTFPFLEALFPVLQDLARKHRFVLRIVGAGRKNVSVEGVEIENLDWSLDREVSDFQNLDIGLYPISVSDSASEDWLSGKSGFKAVQYMAVGVAFVVSPVGVCGEIGVNGETHFNANREEDWYNGLDKLLSELDIRLQMGRSGREYALEHFHLEKQSKILAKALKSVVDVRRK